MLSFKSYALLALSALSTVRCEVFEVLVGANGGLTYTPDSVIAQPGDFVRFVFQSKNHTATQSSFENPCVKVEGGFDSNYVPVAAGQTEFQVAELPITSTEPIWVYCKQGAHCSAGGMVFAVNPGDRLAAFKAAATGAAPATTTTTSAGTTPTATGTPKDIRVVVGGPGAFTFNPPNVQANPGDNIIFEFRQKNHAVVASTFEAPCVPLANSAPGSGFDSGFFPVADDVSANFPTYSVRVNDTKPIWAYCPQGNHCGQGMVFSVNAVEGSAKSFQAFQDLAKQINGTAAGANNGYGGNGAFQTSISGASAAVAALFALAALL